MPCPTEWALGKHRLDLQEVLIVMFKKPVPDTDNVSREVLTLILGTKQILCDNVTQALEVGKKHGDSLKTQLAAQNVRK